MLSLPFALVDGLWMVWAISFNLSVAGAVPHRVGRVAAKTGVVILIYLHLALEADGARATGTGAEVMQRLTVPMI